MKKRLIITLKSDLCAASGEGFSDNIDTDISYDRYGLPYIPARRIKGCLREVALDIFDDVKIVDRIFGVTGSSDMGSLVISNAKLDNYDDCVTAVKARKLSVQEVLNLFTITRAQTAIDTDGSAKDSSLRFTRVVSRYSVSDSKRETKFVADISCNNEDYENVAKAFKALKNIGYNRNRGLGAIVCTLDELNCSVGTNSLPIIQEGTHYTISYKLRLKTPLMIPRNNGKESEEFIPGSSVLGLFAKYLKNDNDFENFILKDNVVFSNLYPYAENNRGECIPAPSIIAKDKHASGDEPKYVLTLGSFNTSHTIKPLKDGYVDAHYYPYEVETEICYHNNLADKVKNGTNTLYTQKCVSEGQTFYGTISGGGKYIKKIAEILTNNAIMFGRSKTAQYSQCELMEIDVKPTQIKKVNVSSNDKVVLIFTSDAILLNESGNYTPTLTEVCANLKIDENKVDKEKSALFFTTITGFNAKRGHKNPHIRAVRKGSTIVASGLNNTFDEIMYIGQRNGEGFGRVFVKKESDIKIVAPIFENSREALTNVEPFNKATIREDCRNKAVKFAFDNRKKLVSLTAAFVGRISLMIEQASDKDDLEERIKAIKTDGKRKESLNLFNKFKSEIQINSYDEFKEYFGIVFTLAKNFIKQKGEL